MQAKVTPVARVFELKAVDVAESCLYDHERKNDFMKRPDYRLGSTRERMLQAMVLELGIKGGWFYQFVGSYPIGPYDSKRAAELAAIAAAAEGRS